MVCMYLYINVLDLSGVLINPPQVFIDPTGLVKN